MKSSLPLLSAIVLAVSACGESDLIGTDNVLAPGPASATQGSDTTSTDTTTVSTQGVPVMGSGN